MKRYIRSSTKLLIDAKSYSTNYGTFIVKKYFDDDEDEVSIEGYFKGFKDAVKFRLKNYLNDEYGDWYTIVDERGTGDVDGWVRSTAYDDYEEAVKHVKRRITDCFYKFCNDDFMKIR